MRLRRHDVVWLFAVVSLLLSGTGGDRSPSPPPDPAELGGRAAGAARTVDVQDGESHERAPVPRADVAGPAAPDADPAPRPDVVQDPARVRIPAIGVDAEVVHLGTTAEGALDVPSDPGVTGWWADGVRPGRHGPAVIAGHVDWTDGPAVFFRLGELRPGDVVEVEGRDGHRLTFTVVEILEVPKEEFPTATVYGPTERPTLRLITCGGPFDRAGGHYLHNVVVTAEWSPPHR